MDIDPTAAVSTGLLWVIALLIAAVALTQSGILGASLAGIVGLMVLGGLLLMAVGAFVRYYTADERRLL